MSYPYEDFYLHKIILLFQESEIYKVLFLEISNPSNLLNYFREAPFL